MRGDQRIGGRVGKLGEFEGVEPMEVDLCNPNLMSSVFTNRYDAMRLTVVLLFFGRLRCILSTRFRSSALRSFPVCDDDTDYLYCVFELRENEDDDRFDLCQ